MEVLIEMLEFIWIIVKNLHLWLILTAIATMYTLQEGVIEASVGFASLFFLIFFFEFHEVLGEYIMSYSGIAIGLGLFIGFCIWLLR
jgi:hypothetical protein